MKKKTILSIALAAILVLAFATTGMAADVPVKVTIDNSNPNPGDTVNITVSCTGNDIGGFEGKVTTSGLKYISDDGQFSNETQLRAMGSGSVTYTYTVEGQPGDAIKFSLSDVKVGDAAGSSWHNPVGDFAVSGTVEAAVNPQPSTQPSEDLQPSEDPSEPTQQPSEPTGEPSAQPSDSQNADELDDVPKTGDATTDLWVLAVVGIAAAATGAVVAGKKVFSHK